MLSENLKTLRKARGLSQEELAGRLHVVRQTVSKWEKGLSVPDAELLVRLSEELGHHRHRSAGAGAAPGGGAPMPSRPSWPPSMSSWRYGTAGPGGSGRWWPVC